MAAPKGVEVTGAMGERYDEVLTPEALELLAELHRELRRPAAGAARRRARSATPELAAGGTLDFLAETADDPRGRLVAGGRRPRPAWSTGGSRSPARPTGR